MNLRHASKSDEPQDVRVMCGWCGRLLREPAGEASITSHGICERCARVLEMRPTADESLPPDNLLLSKIEEHTNLLMCRLYESRQSLLDVQRRAKRAGDLIQRINLTMRFLDLIVRDE